MIQRVVFFAVLLLISFSVSTAFAQQDLREKVNGWMEQEDDGFVKNAGQISTFDGELAIGALYSKCSSGLNLFITTEGLTYYFQKTDTATNMTEWARVDMQLTGGEINANRIQESDFTYAVNNYFLGNCPNGISNVRGCKSLLIEDIYPGIDWRIKCDHQTGIKYDFIVHPGADPSAVHMTYLGADGIEQVSPTALSILCGLGKVMEGDLYSFTRENNMPVISGFVLNDNEVTFDIEDYDRSKTLVIDPPLTWATYFGGNSAEYGYCIATDASGNVFIAGTTQSGPFTFPLQNPMTTAYYQGALSGVQEGYIAKFNSAGVKQWCTYYGGNGFDWCYDMVVDISGNVIITGQTSSSNFPLQAFAGGYNQAFSGGAETFIVKFDNGGTRLWATYFGGTSFEIGYGVTTDTNGNLYFTGSTGSTNMPLQAPPGPGGYFDNNLATSGDAYILKFNANNQLVWSTYYGGNGDERGLDIVVSGNTLYVGLRTSSGNLPNQSFGLGSYQVGALQGGFDLYFLRFDATTCARQWATYFGGTGEETTVSTYGNGMTVDGSGNLYVMTTTESTDFPTVALAGAYNQSVFGGGLNDAGIIKFNSSTVLQWSTYFGASGNDEGHDIATGSGAIIYVSGRTSSTNFPVLNQAGSFNQANNAGLTDGFFGEFSSTGAQQWTTYYGGSGTDYAHAIAVGTCNVYLVGWAGSVDLQTVNPGGGAHYVGTNGGTSDTYFLRFSIGAPTPSITASGPVSFCAGGNVQLDAGAGYTGYSWSTGATTQTITVTTSGNYSVTVTNACGSGTSTVVPVTVFALPTVNASGGGTICSGDSIQLTASGAQFYQWTPSSGLSNAFIANPMATPLSTTTYTVTGTDANGCTGSANVTVTVNPTPVALISMSISTGAIMQKAYGATGDDFPHGGYQTSDGGYVVTGHTTSFGSGGPFDCYLLKTDANGTVQWSRAFGGTGMDDALCTIQTSDGGFMIAGIANSFSGGAKGYLVKTDASGNLQWSRTYAGGTSTSLYSVVQTSDGGYAAAGGTNGFGAGSDDVLLVKLDASGNTLWTRTYGGAGSEGAYALQEKSTGGYIIAGVTSGFGAGSSDVYVVSTDAAGTLLWTRTCGGPGQDLAGYSTSVQETSAGEFVVAGSTQSFGAGNYDYYLIKLSAAGVVLWTKTYGGTGSDMCNAVDVTADGGYILGGQSFSFSLPSQQTWLVKTDSNGNVVWSRAYGGAQIESGAYTQQTSDGGYFATGITGSFGAGMFDAFILKTDSAGVCGCNESAVIPVVSAGGTSSAGGVGNTAMAQLIPATIQTNVISAEDSVCFSNSMIPLCAGDSVTLTASGGVTYLWSTGAVTSSIVVAPSSTTTYSVTAFNGTCTDSASATVPVLPSPNLAISGTDTICNGETALLIASGASTYLWNTGSTNDSLVQVPASTTTYTVTGAIGMCADSMLATVTVNPSPVASITGDTSICSGQNAILTATGGGTYSWNTAATTAAITVSPMVTSTYTVHVAIGQCNDSTVFTVNVTNTPTVSVSGNLTICSGDTTLLIASGAGSYVWSTSATNDSVFVNPTSATSYTVTGTAGVCSDTESVSVAVSPGPVATITGSNMVCAGDSVVLTAGGGGNYAWSTGATSAAITVAPSSTTSYSVVVSAGSCADTTSASVAVNQLPTLNVSSTDVLCFGDSSGTANATVSGGSPGYMYQWAPLGGTSANAAGLPAGTYSCTVTDTLGCMTTQQVIVSEPALLTVTTSFNDATCGNLNGDATATPSGGTSSYSYAWSPSGGNNSTATGLGAGIYTCTIIDANGCTVFDTVTIQSTPSVTVTPGLLVDPLCGGDSTGIANVTASGGTPGFSYNWSPYGGNAATANNLVGGTYTCIVTDAVGCTQTQIVTLTSPVAISVNSTQQNLTCYNDSTGTAQVTVSGGSPSYTYQWLPVGGSSNSATALPAGSYTCVITDANGCTETQSFIITEPIALNLLVTGTDGCGSSAASADATVSGGTAGYSYSWSPSGGNSATANGLSTGSYSCTVTDLNGCTVMQSVVVNSNPGPAAFVAGDTTIYIGTDATLTASGTGSYSWSPSGTLNCATCATVTASPLQTTMYCVTITDTSGCADTACATVTVDETCGQLFVPNAFSPNNDGENDELCIFGYQCVKEFHFVIYDRWGEKVFESANPEMCWNGIYRGKPLDSAVFVYKIYAVMIDETIISDSGNITLVR